MPERYKVVCIPYYCCACEVTLVILDTLIVFTYLLTYLQGAIQVHCFTFYLSCLVRVGGVNEASQHWRHFGLKSGVSYLPSPFPVFSISLQLPLSLPFLLPKIYLENLLSAVIASWAQPLGVGGLDLPKIWTDPQLFI